MSMRIVGGWIDYGDTTAVNLGARVPGDMVVNAGAFIQEAFNGTTPTIDIGWTANDDAVATDISGAALGAIAADDLAAVTNVICTSAEQFVGKFVSAGGTPSTGKAYIWLQVVNDNPLNYT